MPISQILMIVLCSICFLLLIALGISFSISRKSQRVMESLLTILTAPERAQVTDASRVLAVILSDEIAKINAAFHSIKETLQSQINVAQEMHKKLGEQNDILVNTADDATKKVANMSQRLENTVGGLHNIVESDAWAAVENSTDRFVGNLDETLSKINTTTNDVNERVNNINEQISRWIDSGRELNGELNTNFENNANQMKSLTDETHTIKSELENLSQSVSEGFDKIKTSSEGYEGVLRENDKMMNEHLVKLDAYSKQAK